jgi:alginate O-acetyltransferase complex protein AlgI
VDVYKKHTPVEKNFVNFALYVTFFPQLIAGPIIRYHEIAEQIKKREHSFDKFFEGVFLFSCGLAMKVLLANQIAAMSINLGDAAGATSSVLWLIALCYAFQIYYDFAGYSKMAIGLGKMMGFEMPVNFNSPYLAVTVGEFWRRWHISLMNFFREYVYFPLGGSRVSLLKNCRNILIIFLLSGIWHGANWTFIVWGIYFGIWLVVERVFEEKWLSKIPKLIRRLITFLIVLFGWVIFSAETLSAAWNNFVTMLKFDFSDSSAINFVTNKEWLFFIVAIFIAIFPEISAIRKMERFVTVKGLLAVFFLVYSVLQLAAGGFNPFIYFRF